MLSFRLPHIFASLDDGSLYADNDERSYDSGFESISGKCCAHDTFDRISSIFSVRNDRSGYDCCSALVSGERRSVCHIGIKRASVRIWRRVIIFI